ncbi:MAG TPA: hypothetical protein VGD71_42230 [Kribbella sp.]|jgi:hypothetical protein
MMWDVVRGLRRRRFAATARHWDDHWSLADIHTRYGHRLLAESAENPDLARQVEYWVTALEEKLHHHRCRRHSRTAFSYLSGYANGALRTLFDPDAEVEDCGHTTAAIRMAATCRLALTLGMIRPDQGSEDALATRTGTSGRRPTRR